MMKHERAVEAMQWIKEFGFWHEVFGVTGVVVPPKVKLLQKSADESIQLDRLDSEKGVLAAKIARRLDQVFQIERAGGKLTTVAKTETKHCQRPCRSAISADRPAT